MNVNELRPSRGRIYSLVFLALVAITAAAGCGVIGPGAGGTVDKDTRRQQQFQQLMSTPDIEQATQRYTEMMTTLRSRLETELGIGGWYENPESGGGAGCYEFPDVEGKDKQSRGLRHWISDGTIPDETWPHLVTITEEIARQYDFETPARIIVDRPGDHEITTANALGADLILGTKANTVLHVRTGCHLTVAAHQRGTPSIPQYGR